MMNEISSSFQPMSFRDILLRSLRLYRDNPIKFLGIVVLIKGPYLILGYLLTKVLEIFSPKIPSSPDNNPDQYMAFEFSNLINIILRLLDPILIGPIMIAAMTILISRHILNRDASVSEAYKHVLKRAVPLLGTILLTAIIIAGLLLVCAFLGLSMLSAGGQPGVIVVMLGGIMACILWTWYAFIPQTATIEDEGGFSAMKRSKYLVKGYFIKVFLLMIGILMAITLVTELLSFIVMKAFFFLGQTSISLAEGTSNVISIIFDPFRIAVISLLYYDLRIRKEGFDLEIMAKELDEDR